MTRMWERTILPTLAVVAFVAAALSYIPVARAFRYAIVSFFTRPAEWHLGLLLALPVVLLHEALVRGRFYTALRARVRPGLGAPIAAFVGLLLPLAARLWLFPFPAVPFPLVFAQAAVVELPLSLALSILALGTGRWQPGAAALFILWTARVVVVPFFRGSPVPTLEVVAAFLAVGVVLLVLHRPLAPHREALEGLS